MDCEHTETRIKKADDTENRNGAVIEGLDERWCANCPTFLEFVS